LAFSFPLECLKQALNNPGEILQSYSEAPFKSPETMIKLQAQKIAVYFTRAGDKMGIKHSQILRLIGAIKELKYASCPSYRLE